MEPTVQELSEELKKIRQEQEDLHKSFLNLQGKELLDLSKQVASLESYVKLITKIGPLVLVVASIVLTVLGWHGYDAWKTSIRNEIMTISSQELAKDITRRLDRALYLNADIEEILNILKDKNSTQEAVNDAFDRLQTLTADQPEREFLFGRYIDVCIGKEDYDNAWKHMVRVKERNIFPGGFSFARSFSTSGFLFWLQSLLESTNSKDPESQKFAQDARGYLQMAEEKAADKSLDKDTAKRIRGEAQYYLFLLDLSEGKVQRAKLDLDAYLKSGNELDWSYVATRKWFKEILAKQRPNVSGHLKALCPNTFPDGKATFDYR